MPMGKRKVSFEAMIVHGDEVDVSKVVLRVCRHFDCVPKELYRYGRAEPRVIAARQVAAWVLYESGVSLTQIGKQFQRDHTSILYGVRKVESERRRSWRVRKVLEKLKGKAA